MQPEWLKMQNLSIEELLAIANALVEPSQHERHVELLEKNKEGSLTSEERQELTDLRLAADRLMLRKAYAWSVLRWRGHRIPPLKELSVSLWPFQKNYVSRWFSKQIIAANTVRLPPGWLEHHQSWNIFSRDRFLLFPFPSKYPYVLKPKSNFPVVVRECDPSDEYCWWLKRNLLQGQYFLGSALFMSLADYFCSRLLNSIKLQL